MFFKKKEKFDDKNFKKDLLKIIDEFLQISYDNNLNKRLELEKLRNKVFETSFERKDCDNLYEYFEIISNRKKIDSETINSFIKEVEAVMFGLFKKKKTENTQVSNNQSIEEKNQEKIKQLRMEIRNDEEKLKNIEEKMEDALGNNPQEWKILNQEKRTLTSTLVMKKNALNAFVMKNSNIAISQQSKKQAEYNADLQSSDNYVDVDEVQNIMAESRSLNENISNESIDLNNAIFGNSSSDDEYNRALEERLMNKAMSSSETTQKKEGK